jgi:hypothetical protein
VLYYDRPTASPLQSSNGSICFIAPENELLGKIISKYTCQKGTLLVNSRCRFIRFATPSPFVNPVSVVRSDKRRHDRA